MKKVTIVDYGMGNLRSVQKKLIRVGADVLISSDVNIIKKADKLVLPGVGHFLNGVAKLKEKGIWDVLNDKVLMEKVPILGICLGMQLMTKYSEEGEVIGLGWFDAEVIKFNIENKLQYKIPHMGWNNIEMKKENVLFESIPNEAMFYFVHSYHVVSNNINDVVATTQYEYEFVSVIHKDNMYGVQFHPEKSHDWGEQVFRNFLMV